MVPIVDILEVAVVMIMINLFSKPTRICVVIILAALASCATITSHVYQSHSSRTPPLSFMVLVFPPEVIINLKNAGGMSEPRADWSSVVQQNLTGAIIEYMYENGIEGVRYGQNSLSDSHIYLLRQGTVMMDGVELSQRGGGIGSRRFYALSEGQIKKLSSFGVNYLLIVALTAEVASGGRQAVAILSALAGTTVSTSSSQFRAAIFDLRDGQLAWANMDTASLGDLGNVVKADREEWGKAVEHILKEFPL